MKEKIKILIPFIGSELNEDLMVAVDMAKSLNSNVFDFMFISHGEGEGLNYVRKHRAKNEMLALPKIPDASKGFLHYMGCVFRDYLPIAIFIRNEKPDLIHIFDENIFISWVMPAYMLRAKIIRHIRGLWKNSYTKRFFTEYSHKILSSTEADKRSLDFKLFRKADILHDFVSSKSKQSNNKKLLAKETNSSNNTSFIAVNGFDVSKKTIKVFANMINEICPILEDTEKICLFGLSKDILKDFKGLIENKNISRLVLLNKERICDWVSACDYVIQPLKDTKMNIAEISAFANEKPVFGLNSAIHAELKEEMFLLESFSEARACLDNKQEISKKVEKAKTFYEEKYDIKKLSKELEAIYKDIIS